VDPIARWDARYRAGDLGPSHPSPLLIDAVESISPGRALDLACGAGRNASFLAEQGWSVTAVDGSGVAIDMARSLHPGIEALVIDLEREPLPFEDDWFDLVCLINFLHRPLFAEARRLIRSGGVIVSAIHTVRSTMNPLYTMATGELRSYFDDWETIIDRENEIAELVARKPQR
jgi:SAM-dependent methyltransferase